MVDLSALDKHESDRQPHAHKSGTFHCKTFLPILILINLLALILDLYSKVLRTRSKLSYFGRYNII